ncbi:MAG TPA: chemotaxis protein CheW [Phycisphaerae bacterium]|nr:chemotaxis protein CheW [Phycisphaerae bacterium]
MSELAPIQPSIRTFFTFRAQGRLYGIDVEQIREVSTHVAVTPVLQAPPIVRGLTNLRSRIHLVLDLGPALGLPPPEAGEGSRLIVLKPGVAEDLGLFADCGGDIVPVRPEAIEEASSQEPDSTDAHVEGRASPVVGVCKLDAELMMIIDPARVINAMENAIR